MMLLLVTKGATTSRSWPLEGHYAAAAEAKASALFHINSDTDN